MSRFLLDSNILSEPLRPRPNREILAKLLEFRNQLFLCAPVWHELWFGCFRLPDSKRRAVIERYLQDVVGRLQVLAYDRESAGWHARERARLQAMGRTPPFADGQIAAIAATQSAVLVTRNRPDFADFSGLLLEDWGSPRA